jgi:hypothetical protein
MLDFLDRARMADCKLCSTHVNVHPKLSADGPSLRSCLDGGVSVSL